MNKAYSRINFQNAPSTATPLNATNLNKMDKAINDLDDRIIELSGYQEEAQEAAEQASSSASAAAKAAETATADAEARVNAIIEGLEVYTKEESDKKFASVIKQVATGSPILIKDGTDAGALDFKGKGRSTQRQWSGFDGELLSGAYGASDGKYATNSNYVCSKNPMPCKEGENIKLTYGTSAAVMSLFFYDENMAYLNYKDANNTNGCAFNAPTNASYFHFRINENNATMTPQTAKNITVTVNGSTSYPNPDYPQAIKSVAYGGYFDGELLQGFYDTTGKFVSNANYVCSKNSMPCNGGDSIKLLYGATMADVCFCFYDKDMALVGRPSTASVTEYEVTAPTNAKYVNFLLREASGNITPSNAKHITVTIDNKYALIVKSKGKNLLENTATSQTVNGVTFTVNDDKSVTANGTATATAVFYLSTNLENGNYILSGCNNGSQSTYGIAVQTRVNNTTNIWDCSYNGDAKFEISDDKVFKYCFIQVNNGVTVNNVTFYPMIRPAGTDDTYEPYKETVTYIPLNEPIRSNLDGTVTDEVSLTEVNRRYAEVVFDGTEGFSTVNPLNNTVLFYLRGLTNIKNMGNIIGAIGCSHFTNKAVYNFDVEGIQHTNTEIYIRINKSRLSSSDIAGFKEWLQANPITVIYEFAEPITEEIEPVDIVTYDNVTYISNADNAEMEVTYATDTKSYIDSKFAELHAAIVNML